MIDEHDPQNTLHRNYISEQHLKVIQLNCNSLRNKTYEIKDYIFETKPDVCCLCETMIKNYEPKFRGYSCYWKHREDAGGGLCVLVRDDIYSKEMLFNLYPEGALELQILEIGSQRGIIKLANIYNPNLPVSYNEFNYYFNLLGNNCIMVGDFNAHSPLWDLRGRTNETGRNLVDIIENNDIGILNDFNTPTYIDNRTGTSSTLDLCIVSSNLLNIGQMTRGRDLGSDHFPMESTLDIQLSKVSMRTVKKWNLKQVDWQKWTRDLGECSSVSSPNFLPVDVDTLNDSIVETIKLVSNRYIKKSSGNRQTKRATLWWDDECKRVIQERNNAKNRLWRHPTQENLINHRRCSAIVRYTVKKKKTQAWKNFTSTLTSDTPSTKIWRTIKNIKGLQYTAKLPIGAYDWTEADKANALLTHFTRHCQEENEREDNYEEVPTGVMFPEITPAEIKRCLKHIKNTSPGTDEICNIFLKKAPDNIIELLAYLFNTSLASGRIPAEWKNGIISSIPKPGKDPTLISSYRPITLLSCIGKLMERVIKRRLEFHLEKNDVFTANQSGFRRCRGTIDVLATMKHNITRAMENQEFCVVMYLDLEAAYDTVWHGGLLQKLRQVAADPYLIRWFTDYLTERRVRVRVGTAMSESKLLERGLPQGAVLSPLLFNIMVQDIPKSPHVKVLSYADDITLVTHAINITNAQTYLQNYLWSLNRWIVQWKLKLNANKCAYQIFTKRRNIPNIQLVLNNQPIQKVQQQRVLGIIFDAPKLCFKNHIESLKHEGNRRLTILKAITSCRWGATRNLLRRVYIAYVRSKLEYGCVLLEKLNVAQQKTLDVIQNHAIRIILGARKTTPKLSLEVESHIMPLELRFKFLFMKWYYKIMYSPPNNNNSSEIGSETGFIPFHRNGSFFANRARANLHQLNLQPVKRVATDYLSPVSPTESFSDSICFDLEPCEHLQTTINITPLFNEYKAANYPDHIEIYTDGSKLQDGSAAAAVCIPSFGDTRTWKLNPIHTVLGTELFAIQKALEIIKTDHRLHNENIVIFSDSKSSLHIINNIYNPTYKCTVFAIQELLIQNNASIKFQWVKSHVGIEGNETADAAANLGHNNILSALSTLNYCEILQQLKRSFHLLWTQSWKRQVASSLKGQFLSDTLASPKYRPWLGMKSRMHEVALARLRLGHVGVLHHLHRFNMAESEICEACQVPETVQHFLLECERYSGIRDTMKRELLMLGVTFALGNLLLGGNFNNKTQCKINKIVLQYTVRTGRISEL